MDTSSVVSSATASGRWRFRRSDLAYAAAALWGAWYGMGEVVPMVLGFVGSWLLLYPLLGWRSGSFTRTTAMLFATLLLTFVLGRLWKEGLVRYGMTIPARALPLIDKFQREHRYVPERMEDIPGMPWIPPLFHYEIWDEGRSFSIRSEFDYWDNWSYDEKREDWVHFSM